MKNRYLWLVALAVWAFSPILLLLWMPARAQHLAFAELLPWASAVCIAAPLVYFIFFHSSFPDPMRERLSSDRLDEIVKLANPDLRYPQPLEVGALQDLLREYDRVLPQYIPVAEGLHEYSHKYDLAGTTERSALPVYIGKGFLDEESGLWIDADHGRPFPRSTTVLYWVRQLRIPELIGQPRLDKGTDSQA